MKKLTAIILAAVVLCSCVLSSCGSDFKTQSMYANDILKELITAIENDDNEAVEKMFSENARRSSELEDQVQEMLDYFEGEVIEYDKIKDCSGDEARSGGETEYSHITNASCEKIVTDKCTYSLSFAYYLVDANKSEEGMHRIWIGKSDDDYMIVGEKNR